MAKVKSVIRHPKGFTLFRFPYLGILTQPLPKYEKYLQTWKHKHLDISGKTIRPLTKARPKPSGAKYNSEAYKCATLLLAHFEYRFNLKYKEYRANKRNKKDQEKPELILWQYQTTEDLINQFKFSKPTVIKAIKILSEKGFITIARNPNYHYSIVDNKRWLYFEFENIQKALDEWERIYIDLYDYPDYMLEYVPEEEEEELEELENFTFDD